MKTTFLGREYASPLWVASGTFGWGMEAREGGFWPKGLGAVVTKGVSPAPMDGAPHPRIFESGHGTALLNAIGLQNPGLTGFLAKYAAYYDTNALGCPVWVNVLGTSIEGYSQVIRGVREHAEQKKSSWLAGFEINVSCPNVDKGGAEFGSDPALLESLVKACVVAAGTQPVMAKLSPQSSDAVGLARAVEQGGAAAISVVNTMPAGVPEPEKRNAAGVRWSLGRRYGGLSGPGLRPIALRMVDVIRAKSSLPICGIGGIENAHDVAEFLAAGASVVQVGTANFANPWVVEEIFDALSP